MPRPRADEKLLTASERALKRATELAPRTRTDRNLTPLVGWHPPQDLQDWLKAEQERRGGGRGARSDILTEALEMFRAHRAVNAPAEPSSGSGCYATFDILTCVWSSGHESDWHRDPSGLDWRTAVGADG